MRRTITLALGLALFGGVAGDASADGLAGHVTVETRNLYLGADLTPILAAPDPLSANLAILAALEQIADNRFPERARRLALEIAITRPHLVGLQEVFSFTRNGLNDEPPFRDMLQDLLDALAAKGAQYVVAASVQNLDIALPVDADLDGAIDFLVGAIDRDVILVRADVAATPVPFSALCARPSADGGPGCNYSTIAVVPPPLGPINIERGFVGVDASVGGRTYRFVNTHLEVMFPAADPLAPAIQAAQATELSALLAASRVAFPLPPGGTALVAGDINSSPEDRPFPDPVAGPFVPPYAQLAGGVDLNGTPTGLGALTDVWDLRRGNSPGFTCCEDADLRNRRSMHDERIDVIFSLRSPDRAFSLVIGNRPWSRTWPSRLWPSDHAGVVGWLGFR